MKSSVGWELDVTGRKQAALAGLEVIVLSAVTQTEQGEPHKN